jgi:2-oxoglutarate ferredoxin oxidoreductase subunit gamma
MNKDRYEVIMAGSGGQGLVLSGMMLAEAAILEEKNVVQTVSYGIASRGGFSMAEVIIDKQEIIFQQVQQPDVVLILTEEAMEKFHTTADQGTSIFYDTTLMKERKDERFYGQPFTELAAELGHVGTANVIALGYIARITGILKIGSLAEVIRSRFSAKIQNLNLNALQKGVDLVTGNSPDRMARC